MGKTKTEWMKLKKAELVDELIERDEKIEALQASPPAPPTIPQESQEVSSDANRAIELLRPFAKAEILRGAELRGLRQREGVDVGVSVSNLREACEFLSAYDRKTSNTPPTA